MDVTNKFKTVTFDPAVYKLVPINPTQEMEVASHGTCNNPEGIAWLEECMHQEWALMLAAVPDQLHGVVEHNGEPVAFVTQDDVQDFGKGQGESCFLFQRSGKWSVALYTNPAPSQPSAEVLVQAALEAAAKECDEEQNAYSRQEDNQPPEFMVEASTGCYVCATRIRALSAQQIIESCKEKS